jgi:hypothetical protein
MLRACHYKIVFGNMYECASVTEWAAVPQEMATDRASHWAHKGSTAFRWIRRQLTIPAHEPRICRYRNGTETFPRAS